MGMGFIGNRPERGPIDKLLLKQLAESIRLHKRYLTRLQRFYSKCPDQRKDIQNKREFRVLEAELRMLRSFAVQIEWLQMEEKSRRSSTVEQPLRKR